MSFDYKNITTFFLPRITSMSIIRKADYIKGAQLGNQCVACR